MQEFLFGGQFGLALGRDLSNKDIPGANVRSDLNNPGLIEVSKGFFADVGNVPGKLFATEFRFADFDVEFLDVDRGIDVLLDEFFADNDGVFVVVAIEGHEAYQNVPTEGQFAQIGRGTVGDNLTLFHLVADLDNRLLVQAGPFIETLVFFHVVDIGTDFDAGRIDERHFTGAAGTHDHG